MAEAMALGPLAGVGLKRSLHWSSWPAHGAREGQPRWPVASFGGAWGGAARRHRPAASPTVPVAPAFFPSGRRSVHRPVLPCLLRQERRGWLRRPTFPRSRTSFHRCGRCCGPTTGWGG
jgi:hypothetical protein